MFSSPWRRAPRVAASHRTCPRIGWVVRPSHLISGGRSPIPEYVLPRGSSSEAGTSCRRRGSAAGVVRRHPAGRAGPAGEAHVEPVPAPRRRSRRPAWTSPGLDRRDRGRRRRRGPPRCRACAPTRTSSTRPCRTALIPLVVPQLRTITLGGAVTGLGHRGDQLPQRLPARVGARDGRLHRRRGGGHHHGPARRPLRHLPQLLRLARLRHPAAHRARAGARPTCGCGTSASTTPGCWPRPSPTIVETGEYDGQRVDGIDGVAFAARRALPDPGARGPTSRGGAQRPATTPASRSTTARSRSARPTCSRCTTTSGAGTPTGSGAPARSAPSTPSCAGCGRAAGAAPTSTTGWSGSTAASGSPTGSTAGPGGPSGSG